MNHLKLFEEHGDNMLVGIPPEFWKMVKVANWTKAIEEYHMVGYDFNKILEDVRCRVYKEYDFDDIKVFEKIYDDLYSKVYEYFNPHYDMIDMGGGGDDSWSDFLSSIIGRGENFLIKAIKKPYILSDMEYMENFKYILLVDYDDYDKIKHRIFYDEIDKYNI